MQLLRSRSSELLNRELIERVESCANLVSIALEQSSYDNALACGSVKEVRKELMACFRLGVRLESWVNTFTPPLSAGGNTAVSAEVRL